MAVNWKPVGLLLVGALVVQVMVLHLMGQPAICACGSVRLWAGTVLGPENSQQITDWYTPSHVIHGLLFYALGWLLLRGRSPLLALALALGIEIGWELVENSPPMIARYREQALAQGYSGDSILNSLCDTTAMLISRFRAGRQAHERLSEKPRTSCRSSVIYLRTFRYGCKLSLRGSEMLSCAHIDT